MSFLSWCGVLNRDYKKWMLQQTDDLINVVNRYAQEQSGRPVIHLNSWRADKEKLARKRQEQAEINSGLVGVWSCMESCWSYRALQGGRRPAARHRCRSKVKVKERHHLHLLLSTFTFWKAMLSVSTEQLLKMSA